MCTREKESAKDVYISNPDSMEIWYINLRKSSDIQTSLIFSNAFITVNRSKRTGYTLDIMRQTGYLIYPKYGLQ